MIITIIAFIVIFSVLILVHEWGHFAAARHAGVKVEEFGIGLPPQAKKVYKDKKGTVYSLNWIPFGGFVRMFGEDSTDPKVIKNKNSFASKSMLQRTYIIVAGVFMNFVLAWVLITIGFTVGMHPFLATQEDVDSGIKSGIVQAKEIIYIHEIAPNEPLSKTAIKPDDYITAVNGMPVTEGMDLSQIIKPDTDTKITYVHGTDAEKTIDVIANDNGKLGMTISQEKSIKSIGTIKYPFYIAPIKAVSEIYRLSILTVKMVGNLVVSLVAKFTVPEGVSGPVGIAKMTSYFAKQGFVALMQFTALLSISLGVINIMPFPALDGGRFLFIIFELIARKKPNAKWETVIHSVGFGLLILMILVITWKDIIKLF
jgi:regulator of sigma E protease